MGRLKRKGLRKASFSERPEKEYDTGNILPAIHITRPYLSGSDQSDSWRETKGIQDRCFKEIIQADMYGGMNRVERIHKEWGSSNPGSNESEKLLLSLGWKGQGRAGTGVCRAWGELEP